VVFDIELGVDEVLYLLFLPGFTFFEQVKKTRSLLIGELRGPTAPEARGKVYYRIVTISSSESRMENDIDRGTMSPPYKFTVCPTSNRNFSKEYIVQINNKVLHDRFPNVSEGEFLLVRSPGNLQTEVHARVQVAEDLDSEHIGLDFTLRTALGAPSELEVEHGEAEEITQVEVESIENPEDRLRRRYLNDSLGVRPQVCRVRMGVFPDLEDKVCRLPKNTMQMIGVEEGENVTIESTRGDRIIRGVKTFEIDEERRQTKKSQKIADESRYPPCEDLLGLARVRRTEVDIPEIWIDEESRTQLGIGSLPKSGVCQPVRVYRDTWYLFQQKLSQFTVPLVAVLFATAFEIQSLALSLAIWILTALIWTALMFVESRTRLH